MSDKPVYRNPDWEMSKKRMAAFWEHEIIDRPVLQIYIDEPNVEPDEMDAYGFEDRWTDPETFVRVERNSVRKYLGEGYPSAYPNWASVPEMLGCEMQYAQNTIWSHPAANSILDLSAEKITIDSPVVTKKLDFLEKSAKLFGDDVFLGMPPFGNSGDDIAKVLGYQQICFDLYDEPEAVITLDKKITDFSIKCYDACYEAISKHMDGTSWWLPAWHPRKSVLIEFDLGGMISPEMYKLFLPHLIERAEHAERSIYHLDGPGALVHLDTILAQKEFDAVQWEPGTGGDSFSSYLPVMKRIQDAGKGLYVGLTGVEIDEALYLLSELKPEGLMMPIHTTSVDEAKRFLEKVEKMY